MPIDNTPKLTQTIVEDVLAKMSGIVTLRDLREEIGIRNPENKAHLRTIMSRLAEQGILVQKWGRRQGEFRIIDTFAEDMDFHLADSEDYLDIKLPLGLNKFCRFRPGDMMIVAGDKSAGKTAFLYNIIKLNCPDIKTWLWNNETGKAQMKKRFQSLWPAMVYPPPFNPMWKLDSFGDVISQGRKDDLHIIDYISVDMNEIFSMHRELEGIWRAISTGKGLAIVGMQKKPDSRTMVKGVPRTITSDLAYGGNPTLFRSSVYLAMSEGRIKIVEVKNPVQNGPNAVHPRNKQIAFDLPLEFEGTVFTNVTDYTGEG